MNNGENGEKKKFVAYIRGSKKEVDVENQIFEIKRWAEQHGYDVIISKDFIDENVSGWKKKPQSRPAFQNILRYCEENNIKNIVFYSVDRLARNYFDGIEIVRFFFEHGFNIEFAKDEFLSKIEDPTMKALFLGFLFYVAEMYARSVSEKVKTALARLKAQGVKLGRPAKITPEIRERVKELREQGYSYSAIAMEIEKEFGISISKAKISYILRGKQ